jgi:hypothetical protein
MKWNRRFLSLGLALALSFTVSCTSADNPTGPELSQQTEQPSQLLGDLLGGDLLSGDGLIDDVVDGTVGTLLNVTDLLVCSSQPYQRSTEIIGREGGTIEVGTHSLVIPSGALERPTRITAEQVSGRNNSIRFSPEGLEFQKPASLTMSYRNCLLVLIKKKIVYTDENLKILEVLRSFDLFGKRTVTAPIDHFSRYVVAY